MKKMSLFAAVFAVILPGIGFASDLEATFKYAVQARLGKQNTLALSLLADLERDYPRNAHVKLEKGFALAQAGQCRAAQSSFDAGWQIAQMPEFKRAAEDALNHLCPSVAGFERGFYGEVIQQSNANGGTEAKTVTINGNTYELFGDALAESGAAAKLGGSLAYNLPLTRNSYVIPFASADAVLRQGVSQNDLNLQFGMAYRYRGDRIDWRAGPTIGASLVGSSIHSRDVGIFGRANISLDHHSAATFSARVENKKFDQFDENVGSFGATYLRSIGGGHLFKVGLNYQQTNSPNYTRDLNQYTLHASASGPLPRSFGYEVYAAHTRIASSDVDPFFAVKRKDEVSTIGLNVALPLRDTMFGRPFVGISHTSSRSNFATKNFDNTSASFGFTKQF